MRVGFLPGRRGLWIVVAAAVAVVVIAAIVAGTGLLGSGPGAKPSPAPSPGTYRTKVEGFVNLQVIAADGRGTVWIAGSAADRLVRYRPVGDLTTLPIQPAGTDPHRTSPPGMAPAPDGSVWWIEPEDGTARRITPDGKVTSLNLGDPKSLDAGHYTPALAVTRDGSLWFRADGSLNRIFADGHRQTYDVPVKDVLVADSKGDVWSAADYLYRVTPAGKVTRFAFSRTVVGVAEGRDGAMWLLDSGVDPTPRLGYLDASGAVSYFPFRNLPSYYRQMVRAPDGAVWFWTSDGRLVRAVSRTDVTVYQLPWSDIRVGLYKQEPLLGPFVVLPGNRVVIAAGMELLDFAPTGGTRLADVGALPTPTPYQAQSPAEAAAYAAVRERFGADSNVRLFYKVEEPTAAAFLHTVTPAGGGLSYSSVATYVYLSEGTWKVYETANVYGIGSRPWGPWKNMSLTLKFREGCLNVRASPSPSAEVKACLASGTTVMIDDGPVYADGVLWWHLADRGWAAHQYLWCTSENYQSYQQC